jgi:hypothetical protein
MGGRSEWIKIIRERGAVLKRLSGYLLSAVFASLFYIVWMLIFLGSRLSEAGQTSLKFKLGLACFFLIFGGFGLALALMSLPWIIAARWYRRLQCRGQVYFSGIGAFLMLSIGCITSALSPKPSFIQDQTVLEGIVIAGERQGICLILAGAIFGLSYWFLCERPSHLPNILNAK